MISNLAVVRGAVAGDPLMRDLPGGGVVAQFDVTTRLDIGDRQVGQTVPVAWNDPAGSALAAIGAGVDVTVVGTVRRRFFRVGGATQSRTEVVADSVIPTRRRSRVDAALGDVVQRLLE